LEEEKFYNKDWFMWLMFVIFIPIGIVLMWKNRRYNTLIRSIVSTLYLFLFICEYTAITTGNISGMITLICVFVLIPYIIVHWKQVLKKSTSHSSHNTGDVNYGAKQNRKQKSVGLAVISVVLFALGIYTLNNSYKNSNQNVNSNKSNTAQASKSNVNANSNKDVSTSNGAKKLEEDFMKEGMYKVDTDIQAGEYIVIANSDSQGYMQISKDSTGSTDSIIGNEIISGRTYVAVNDGEYLTVKNAKIYTLDKAPKVDTSSGTLSDGMYKVGTDIQAGEYKANASNDEDAYVEVTSNSRHNSDGIVSNDIFKGEKYITVGSGQYIKLQKATLTLK